MNLVDPKISREVLRALVGDGEGAALAGTGHRPVKLLMAGLSEVAMELNLKLLAVDAIRRAEPAFVISGMAVGWDMALAEAAVETGCPLVAAVPFSGQESRWPPAVRRRYAELLELAAVVAIIGGEGFHVWKMHARNRWMVDRSDAILALWNGDEAGGTAATIKYAGSVDAEIVNLWDDWASFLRTV